MSQRSVRSVPAVKVHSRGHSGWMDLIGQRLIRRAARGAPESLSQRLEEEWLADCAARPSAMSRLRFALGCCWATQVIAIEFQPSSVPAAGPAVAGKLTGTYAQHDSGYFSRRSCTLFIVLSLHGLLFYALMNTLSHIHRSATPEPLVNRLIDNPRPHEFTPRLPDPRFNDVKLRVPPIDLVLPTEPDPPMVVSAKPAQDPPPSTPPSPPQTVNQVLGGPGVGFPNTDDFYPPQARRMDEQGIATVKVCVDAKGTAHIRADHPARHRQSSAR